MTAFKKSEETQFISVRHRALCAEGDYKGAWQTDIDVATNDAIRHKNKNPGHVVKVLSEETSGIDIISE